MEENRAEAEHVVAYSGYQGEQEPRFLVIGGERLALEIRDRWREPEARCFRVTAGGRDYLLRCRLPELEWTVEPRSAAPAAPPRPPRRP